MDKMVGRDEGQLLKCPKPSSGFFASVGRNRFKLKD